MPTTYVRYSLCLTCKKFEPKTYEKFCGQCGSELIYECPECKSEFFKAGDFCTQCGHQLISRSA
jgi:rRNA maturation endonuclease Nob1